LFLDWTQAYIDAANYINRIIIMNPIAIGFLTKVYKVPKHKIKVIEHGVPDFSKLIKMQP